MTCVPGSLGVGTTSGRFFRDAPFGSLIVGVALVAPSVYSVDTGSVAERRLRRRLRLVSKAPAVAVSVEAAERVVAEVVAVESATGLFADAFKGCTAGLAAREVVSVSVASEEEIASEFASEVAEVVAFSAFASVEDFLSSDFLSSDFLSSVFFSSFDASSVFFSSSEAFDVSVVASAFSLEAVVTGSEVATSAAGAS